MDEKGFLIGITGRSKRIFSKQMWERKEITLLACVGADGKALPPGLIYQAAQGNVQSTWVEAIEAGKHQVFVTSSPSGWTNNEIGLAWLEQVFDRYTKKQARLSYRLLILDGHGSHVTQDFLQYLMFKPLSSAYSSELTHHLHASQGLIPIKKGDFFPLFWRAWLTSFKEESIFKSFKATGIWLLEREVILKRFHSETYKERDSSSGLSEADWRKMRALVQSAVKEGADKQANKITYGLREALTTKSRHKNKGKALDLQQREEYHGGAVFWSPRKLREACVRQEVREQEDRELRLQKAEVKELKAAATLYKQKIAEEKRVQRERVKNTARAIQLSQKGKRKALRPPAQKPCKKQAIERGGSTVGGGEAASEPLLKTTRRGRSVNLPSKYK
ncbi:hypothetical protein P154DRAFT_541823 [Amniculicola lignicola CBS 123094]|uniref:DDE-1 domain-containing protein n=1 Tax=Amniculicola lignicola CBS 123094 TaxID=1392246 RepID=A0A6A5X0S5_9PLEO|nr:hypothetical protein P154DRAFT_541823 [Amniculicola lignicola CBS 123094]